MRKTFTQQQERIAIAALAAGHHVWRDDEPGEFGPTVDVRVGEPQNGSVIVFWCDGSVSISTSSRNLAGHAEAAARASQLAAELLAAPEQEPARLSVGKVDGQLRTFRMPQPGGGELDQDLLDEGSR